MRLRDVATLAALVCVFLQLYGGRGSGEAGAGLGFVFAAVAAYRADPRYLGSIVILCFPAFGFGGGDAGEGFGLGLGFGLVSSGLQPDSPVIAFNLAGGDISAPIGVLIGAFARLVRELRVPSSSLASLPRWTFILFLLALVPAVLGAIQGQLLGFNRWSQGVRGMLALGGVFWGVLISQYSIADNITLCRRVIRLAVIGGALMLLGVLRGHFVFLIVGIAAGALVYLFRSFRIVAFVVALLSTAVGLLSLTLTTAAEAVIALGGTLIARIPLLRLRYWGRRIMVIAVVMASIGTLYAVLANRATTSVSAIARLGADGGIAHYALGKLFDDRGPLWLAAFDQVVAPPWLIVPAGRPLFPRLYPGAMGAEAWEFGAHNSFLELIHNVGWLAGGIGSALMVWAILASTKVLSRPPHRVVGSIAAGFIGVSVAGITTGNFPVQDMGFFVWALGGIAIGSYRLETDLRSSRNTN